MVEKILLFISSLLTAATLLPLYPSSNWWISSWNFPRLQIFILLLTVLVLLLSIGSFKHIPGLVAIFALSLCAIYQGSKIYPYTKLGKPEITETAAVSRGTALSLMVSNVLMENRDEQKVLQTIASYNPDIVCLIETDAWWKEKLQSLEKDYQHNIFYPLDNTYGMILYSKFPLVKPEIKFLSSPEIPSIHTFVELPDGSLLKFYCVHPPPPAPPNVARTSNSGEKKDAELIQIGRMASKADHPVIVLGDLNDVAWSQTTATFQEVSGLVDPRKGRGMFNTFHADYFFLRFPLDHIFVSPDFKVVRIKKLPDVGSDHFPFFIELKYDDEQR